MPFNPPQLECLVSTVGLSPTTDPCFDTGKPANAGDSISGLFISTLLRLAWVDGATDDEIGNVWDILTKARNEGIQKVILDYIKLLSGRKKERFLPFNGHVGDTTFNLSLTGIADFQAIEFQPREAKGSFLAVTGVELALDLVPPENITVSIYKSSDLTTPLRSVVVNITASNTFTKATFADPIELDLSDLDENEKYWFVYELPVGAKVKNNKIERGCGCGSLGGRIDKNRFLQFGRWRGVQSDSIATLTTPKNTTSDARGLRITSAASCDFFSWLCDISKNVNEITTSINAGDQIKLGMTLADLIQLASAIKAADVIVSSTNINRITTLKKEQLWGKMNMWKKQYNEGMVWFVNEVPSYVNECFVCKRDSNISLNSVLV